MDHKIIYYLVLMATLTAALWRGGSYERWGATIAATGSVTSTIAGLNQSWQGLLGELLLIDLLVLAGFWWLSFRSDRFWPYWVTGWQLVAVLVHLQRALFADILPTPYALMSLYLAYPTLLLILYASVQSDGQGRAAIA